VQAFRRLARSHARVLAPDQRRLKAAARRDGSKALEIDEVALDAVGIDLSDVEGKPFWTTFWRQVSKEIRATLRQSILRALKGNVTRQAAAGDVRPDFRPVLQKEIYCPRPWPVFGAGNCAATKACQPSKARPERERRSASSFPLRNGAFSRNQSRPPVLLPRARS
jgi:hypothetical protein